MVRKLIALIDQTPAAPLLGTVFTTMCRSAGVSNLRFFKREHFWHYGVGDIALPHARKFNFYKDDFRRLPERIDHYLHETNDCWFYIYKPAMGHVIVDVGAEIGTDAIVFSRAVGQKGKVIAIEAQPETYCMLKATIRENGLRNVEAISLAVADKPGEVHISDDAGIESNFLTDKGEAVAADTLDNILKDVPKIDFLKMNIEGAERLAILGMDQTIAKTENIAIACHDFVGPGWFETKNLIEDYLERHGFEVRGREKDPREYVQFHVHGRKIRR